MCRTPANVPALIIFIFCYALYVCIDTGLDLYYVPVINL